MGRPRQHKQTTRLSISFKKADYDRVVAIAEANDVSTAWVIRKAVTAYLEAFGYSTPPIDVQLKQQRQVSVLTTEERQSR